MPDTSPRPGSDPDTSTGDDAPGLARPATAADPHAVTALPELAQIRAARPWTAAAPRVLAIILGVAIWPGVTSYSSSLEPSPIYLVVFLAEVLVIFGTFGVAKGRWAGRILAVVSTGVILVVLVPYIGIGFADPDIDGRLAAGAAVLGVLVSLAMVALMYRPGTSAYISAVTDAMAREGKRSVWPY